MSDKPQKVIDAAVSQIGSPYVFGAWGAFCTPAERKKRYGYHPEHQTIVSKCQVLNGSKPSCDRCKWQGDRCFDCRGFTDWCLNQVDIDLYGEGATAQYSTKENWLERGKIDSMPECVCCVFVSTDGSKKSHTGLYIGNGQTIECSGTVYQKELARKWTHYAIPKGLYTAEEIAAIRKENPRPKGILRKGDTGTDVENLQGVLNRLGYGCGKADGIFGTMTLAAVKAFQADHGLVPDGIVGPKTWTELLAADGVPLKRYEVVLVGLSGVQAEEIREKFPDAIVKEVNSDAGVG
jgi:hypothetical protein